MTGAEALDQWARALEAERQAQNTLLAARRDATNTLADLRRQLGTAQ